MDSHEAAGVSPVEAPGTHRSGRERLRSYIVGLALAVVLTMASFAAASSASIWGPGVPVLLAVLAVAQMGVHLVFFLHISSAPDSVNTVLALVLGIFVVALVVFGSLIIMGNLDTNMMPPQRLMQMQQ